MRKVDLIDQTVRPCNFNDFYYYHKYFNDKKIEAVHEMVRRGGYKFEKVGLVATINQKIIIIQTIEIMLMCQVILILGGCIMNSKNLL